MPLVQEDEKSKGIKISLSQPPSIMQGTSHDIEQAPWLTRIIESVQRDPNASKNGEAFSSAKAGEAYDVESAARATAASPLLRLLKQRHLQMIAIGGSVGTGLFVSSGQALAQGGPASLVIGFIVVGIQMYCTLQALGEMAVLFPVAGSFATYSTRFLDPAWGFAMGVNYAFGWLITLPLEIVSAAITLDYWTGSRDLNAAWVSIFLVLIITINIFGVKGYGEAECVFSIIKVTAVVGFILLGIVMNIGGGPDGSYIGFTYWRDPGAFNNGFWGLCNTFLAAAFAFSGAELIGLTAAETSHPRKTLPNALKKICWRITLFYVVSLFIVSTLVPYTDPRLLTGSSSVDAKASPFVISIQNAAIDVLPSVMNGVIMISVLSVGNSSVYGSSRTLTALAEASQAPRIFTYIDRNGRPLVSLGLATACGFLCFLAASDNEAEAFAWMIAINGLAVVFTWGSVCLAHIRFRMAWSVQGHELDELPYRSPLGTWGSWLGFILSVLILIAAFWVAITPDGWRDMSASDVANNFFQSYLAAPVVIVFYLAYKFIFGTKVVKLRDIDLFTGKRDMNVKALLMEEQMQRMEWPRWKKIYRLFC